MEHIESALVKRKERKCRDILTTAGYGIIILVLWDFVKSVIYLNWSVPSIIASVNDPYAITFIVLISIELIFCTAFGLVLSKVGRSNKMVGTKTLVVAIILLVAALACFAFNIATVTIEDGFEIMTTVIFIEDILFLFFSIRILYSTITLIKLSKEQNNER